MGFDKVRELIFIGKGEMGMERPKIKDYYVEREDGTKEFDEDKYEKDLQSYLDNEKRQASETAKKKGIDEGKKVAQEEAKLTAEQKFAKDREQWEAEYKAKVIELNKRQVKQIYKESGYDDAEIDVFLELVTDDETSSLEKATKLCDARKKYEEGYKKKMTEEAQKNQASQQGSGSSGSGELSYAAKMAQRVNKAFEMQNNNNN